MNYYKHHIGDYAKKTAHLTVLEHGAYLLMLHAYYGTEKPLPDGEPLYRIVRAFSKAERAAVDSIASQFWTRDEGGLVNGRAFIEMEEATDSRDASRENGKLGGRPKKTQQVIETETQQVISETCQVSKHKPRGEPKHNLLQTPDSRLQNKKNTRGGSGGRNAIPFPVDFTLTEPMRHQALSRFPDCDVDEMFVQFRAHHESHGKVMKSWPAAWTTWVGNAAQFGYPKRGAGGLQWE